MFHNNYDDLKNNLALGFKKRGQVFICLFIFLILLNPIILSAQNYPTRQYTMRNGLPGSAIQSIYKDSRGLMWIGTNAGLCTFNGKSFRIFKPSEGMTANQVWDIAEDDEENMWFGSYGEGLYKYDGKNFKRYTQEDGLANDTIRKLYWSKNFNCLVVGCLGGVSTIIGDTIVSSPTEIFSKGNGSTVTGLVDAGNFIYITTYGNNNPIRYYPNENKFITANNEELEYPGNSFSVFITSKSDTIFSYGHSGVSIFKADKGFVHNVSMGQVFDIAEDKRGDLWFASWSYPNRNMIEGVFRYDGKTFRNYKTAFGITDMEIWTVMYDKEQDILWIGTLNEGLFMVPFSSIEQFSPSYFGLNEQKINNIYIDYENNLWISSKRELIRMEANGNYSFMDKHKMLLSVQEYWKNTQRKIFHVPNNTINLKSRTLNNFLITDFEKRIEFNFQDVNENSNKSIFFTNRFGIFQYDPNTNEIDCFGPEGANDFFAMTGGDTVVYTGSGHTMINSNLKYNSPQYSDSTITSFTENDDPRDVNRVVKNGSKLWYASATNGLLMSEGLNLINFNHSDTTISTHINDVCFDERGHVIFGSNSGEICITTYAENKFKINFRINSDDGLKGNSISWLVNDQQGYLWAGTNLGLNCIDLEELYTNGNFAIRFFDEEEGYAGQTSQKAVIDTSGNLWIGADDRLIKVNTKSLLSADDSSGKIILQSLEINNTSVDSIRKLRHSENDLIFYFDILNYSNPQKDKFRHKLLGYNKDWNQWSSGRKAIYTNLPPGKYSLNIESHNLQTLKQAEPLIIQFSISHPWWGIWYLQILAGAIFFATALFIVWKYSEAKRKKQQQQSEIEKTIVELEMQALQAQMNPHFVFNCINGIQYYVLENKMDEVLAYLSDFAKVVRGYLENATLQMVILGQEIEFLRSYLRLEEMRFEDKFDYEINVLDETDEEIIQLPPMFVQPFVENAIRHGFMRLKIKGRLIIEFEKEKEDVLKCTITDNGIGRENSGKKRIPSSGNDRLHSGLITENRIRLFNQPGSTEKYKIVHTDLFKDGIPSGLKVELFLPLENVRG